MDTPVGTLGHPQIDFLKNANALMGRQLSVFWPAPEGDLAKNAVMVGRLPQDEGPQAVM